MCNEFALEEAIRLGASNTPETKALIAQSTNIERFAISYLFGSSERAPFNLERLRSEIRTVVMEGQNN